MGDETKQAEDRPGEANEPPPGADTPPALRVIGAFGGIRPMASKLSVPVSTVQGWKERGVIPESRHQEIRAAAATHGLALDEADLAASAEGPPETVGEAGAPTPAEPTEPVAAAAAADGPGAGDGEPEDAAEHEARDAAEAPPAPPPAATARRGSGPAWIGGFVLGALVFAVGAGAAVLTKDLWDSGATGADAQDAVSQQLAAVEARLAEIEARPAAPTPPADLATADDVARLEGQIAALGATNATEDLAAAIEDLKAQMATMDASASAGAEAAGALGGLTGDVALIKATQAELSAAVDELKSRDAGQQALLWSAVGALRDALRYAGPFTTELEDVARLAGDRPEVQESLAELRPLADDGVASLAELQRSFPATARDIVAAGYGEREDSVLGDVLTRVSQVVTVRPVGEVEGDGPGAIVARAEGHVEQGDLAAALAELDGLPEAARAAAEPWRQRAEQRIAADAAVAKLNGLLAGQLAAGG
jgi:hypothetical protein